MVVSFPNDDPDSGTGGSDGEAEARVDMAGSLHRHSRVGPKRASLNNGNGVEAHHHPKDASGENLGPGEIRPVGCVVLTHLQIVLACIWNVALCLRIQPGSLARHFNYIPRPSAMQLFFLPEKVYSPLCDVRRFPPWDANFRLGQKKIKRSGFSAEKQPILLLYEIISNNVRNTLGIIAINYIMIIYLHQMNKINTVKENEKNWLVRSLLFHRRHTMTQEILCPNETIERLP
jgi:hypothetical protein